MDSSVALLTSIATILFLIYWRKNVTLAVFTGAILLGLLTLGLKEFLILKKTLLALETLRLLIIITSAFTLGFSMQELGLLKELCQAVEGLCGKFSIVLLPALVGFLPMPGGALVSAIMIKDLVSRHGLSPHQATFVNYWARHVWIPVWPLYPSFILGASIVGVHYLTFIKAGVLISLPMILFGGLFMRELFNFSIQRGKTFFHLKTAVFSFYPVLLVILFALVLKIPLYITLPTTVLVLFLHKRPDTEKLKKVLAKTLDWEILFLIIGVLFYKELISTTGAAHAFFVHLRQAHIPTSLASFTLAFVIGLAVGIEVGLAAIVLPLLLSFTGIGAGFNPIHFALVFAGGFMGIMLSPLHLCLVLTARYYNASLSRVYSRLIPVSLLVMLSAWLVFLIKP